MNTSPARLPITLLSGLLALVVCVAHPLHAETNSLQAETDYQGMSDADLTAALQTWGTLESADRRGLLVELRKRMQHAEQSNRAPKSAMLGAGSQARLRPARITIQIRVRQSMRFGAGIGSDGMLVVRSGNMSAADVQSAATAARHLLTQMRARMARAEPLPGPGFGDGFERRQNYLKASLLGDDPPR